MNSREKNEKHIDQVKELPQLPDDPPETFGPMLVKGLVVLALALMVAFIVMFGVSFATQCWGG